VAKGEMMEMWSIILSYTHALDLLHAHRTLRLLDPILAM